MSVVLPPSMENISAGAHGCIKRFNQIHCKSHKRKALAWAAIGRGGPAPGRREQFVWPLSDQKSRLNHLGQQKIVVSPSLELSPAKILPTTVNEGAVCIGFGCGWTRMHIGSELTMRFLNLLKLHWQISTPSPTKPVRDAKRARIIWNYFHEFVPNKNRRSDCGKS